MFRLKKSEHLCSKHLINDLYINGLQFYEYPFKVIWNSLDSLADHYPLQFLITIPKKSIPSAVNRNKIKRRIREAYRKNKHAYLEYLNSNSKKNILIFSFTEKKILSYHEIEEKIILILQRLVRENEKINS